MRGRPNHLDYPWSELAAHCGGVFRLAQTFGVPSATIHNWNSGRSEMPRKHAQLFNKLLADATAAANQQTAEPPALSPFEQRRQALREEMASLQIPSRLIDEVESLIDAAVSEAPRIQQLRNHWEGFRNMLRYEVTLPSRKIIVEGAPTLCAAIGISYAYLKQLSAGGRSFQRVVANATKAGHPFYDEQWELYARPIVTIRRITSTDTAE